MANGKGSISCSYCKYITSKDQKGFCGYHKVNIPWPKDERNFTICCHFEPNENYFIENAHGELFIPPASKFAAFGIHMEIGKLYEYHYNVPNKIVESAILRIPDWQNSKYKNS